MTGISRRNVIAASGGALAAAAMPGAPLADTGKPLAGKSILVTGTSSGFGNHGAQHYAQLGAKVFATMRNLPRPEADELKQLATDEKLDLQVLELDVLSDEQVAKAIAEAERIAGGPLDILVNNAGVNISGPVEVQDIEATKLSFDTNVYGYLRTIRAVLPGMRSRKSGVIFNVSSQMGRVIMPGGGIYSATKFAVESMSEQLAYELAPHGVEVVIIEPGGFPTNIGNNRARLAQELAERMGEEHASGYPDMVKRMRGMPRGRTWPNAPDPMDVPREIAEIAAMTAGRRPLRRPVHPGHKPQLEINRVCRATQLEWLGRMPFGEWAKAVLD